MSSREMKGALLFVICLQVFLVHARLWDVDAREWLMLLQAGDQDGLSGCGTEEDLFQVADVTFHPAQPVSGKDLRIEIDGHLNHPIPVGSYIELTVKVAGIPLYDGNMDFCQQLDQLSKKNPAVPTCPVQPGRIKLTHVENIPQGAPKGRYEIRVVGFTPLQYRIFCISGQVNLQ